MNIYTLVSGILRLQISDQDDQMALSLDALGCWREPTGVGRPSSNQVDPRGLTEVTQHGVTAKKNTHLHFPSRFPPPHSPVNLFCEILWRVSASLAAPPSPEMRSLRRVRLIFTRWDCDRMESRGAWRRRGRRNVVSQWEK